jgi:MFS transporter, ACS family, hexuronate transporter
MNREELENQGAGTTVPRNGFPPAPTATAALISDLDRPVQRVPAAGQVRERFVPRWWLYLMLFFTTFLNILDRQTINIAAPLIKQELGFNSEQMGRLFSAFLYSYALGHLLVGYIMDRFHFRWTYGGAVGLWSLVGTLTGLARGFWPLFGCRALLGLFEAPNWPGAARIIRRVTVPRERAFANGIMNTGMCLASILAPVVMIWLFNRIGWRWGFSLIGSLGFIWCLFWFAGTWRKELTPPPPAECDAPPEGVVPWKRILASPRFYGILAASVFANAIFYFAAHWITVYMVDYRHQVFGASLSFLLAFIYTGMDVGYLGGGVVVLYLAKSGWGTLSARRIVMFTATVLMCLAALIPLFQQAWIVAVLLCLLNVGRGAWGTNFLTYTQEICPQKVAMLTALSGCAGALGGGVFTWFVGYAWDRGWQAVPFIVLGILPILATTTLFATRDITPNEQSNCES